MPHFYFNLVEAGSVIEDAEGKSLPDDDAATADAIRQIRRMVAIEIGETGQADLRRAIELHGGAIRHRIGFSDAISVISG